MGQTIVFCGLPLDAEDQGNDVFGSTCVLVTGDSKLFDRPLPRSDRVQLWTDNYSNLFRILK